MYNPLNDSHLACCNNVLERNAKYLPLVEACIECGWDVQQWKDKMLQQQQMAERTKQLFFTQRS